MYCNTCGTCAISVICNTTETVWSYITHIIKVDHESNIASNISAELSLTGWQPQASGWSRMTCLPSGRIHILPSLLTVIGQNLSIPLKHKVLKNWRESVMPQFHIIQDVPWYIVFADVYLMFLYQDKITYDLCQQTSVKSNCNVAVSLSRES